ncbi:molybdopterin synthase catalytic subunit MoaE [Pelagibaculum spongiae]|uniref:Molybdopterin synthase catalytic subunit n=2 Tax=Pelagibaculum spongiae TaxID=2080658 RepID=A0A2V1H479_9GAMM|nr:molybdopterin synthase catalytic subunit MoaE [Pelagibaculum spongiae]PVZ71585.1 molybdopterin synthase catalytic subunit MoaE [Pelagibaculum spongiae]
MISVQLEDFNLGDEYQQLSDDSETGAIATFVGRVRGSESGSGIDALYLEHYPAMTQKSLEQIVELAKQRWNLLQVRLIHRFGKLEAGAQIVFVGVSSSHRSDAFAACEFIMDYLKTSAPFWKKSISDAGETWVDAKESDQDRASRWD